MLGKVCLLRLMGTGASKQYQITRNRIHHVKLSEEPLSRARLEPWTTADSDISSL